MFHTSLTLLFTFSLTSFVNAQNNLISPCPRFFEYEADHKEPDRWYGILTMLSDFDSYGVYVQISLNKPALQLGNWYSAVISENSKQFILVNAKDRLKANVPRKIKIFVKYDTSELPPAIEWIEVNSRRVCPDTEITETSTQVQLDFNPKSSRIETTSNKPTGKLIGQAHSTSYVDGGIYKNDLNLLNSLLGPTSGVQSDLEPKPPRIETTSEKPDGGLIGEAPASYRREGIYKSDLNLLATLGRNLRQELNVLTPLLKNETLVEPSPVETTSNKPAQEPFGQRLASSESEEFYMGDFYQLFSTLAEDETEKEELSSANDICGTVVVHPQPLITYGQPTNEGEFPWHVAIYHSNGFDWTYICGASLISQDFVITVAHCVTKPRSSKPLNPNNLSIYLGRHYLKRHSNAGIQGRQISEIIIHAQYNAQMYSDDIALLKLELPADYTDYVRPICLWQDPPNYKSIENKQGKIVGWGFDETGILSDRLMQTEMPVVSQDTCILSNPEFYFRYTSENSFCAGFRNGTNICNGDSGGGMVFPKSNSSPKNPVWQLRGLISISANGPNKFKCDSSHYVVFMDAAKYLNWIKNKIK